MEKVLFKGNEAIAEAAICAGCRLFFGYPITPSTEVVEYLAWHMPKSGGTVLQAEDEIASINMCCGAAYTGARVMTASSGPGISLKQEGLSHAAANELPMVIVDISRAGPGLGGLGPSQADYFQATKGGGHGDYRLIVLAPAKVQEMYDYTMEAFDLADRHRNPVMILAEGFLGQMMEPIELKARPGTVLPVKDWIVDGCRNRSRRRLTSYGLSNETTEAACLHLEEKYNRIRAAEQRWEDFYSEDADYIIAAFGTCARIAKSAVLLARQQGIKLGLVRPITLWPFPEKAFTRLTQQLKGVLTVELSAGQMVEDVRLALASSCVPVAFYGRQGGMLPTEEELLRQVIQTFQPAPGKGV
ncbi:3-methyl-2-oxobutanoate dehydrogenase subunit VorB [Acetonema longum]|uniref:Pyruvate flavodoxin/ferredoxin oxidoreductase domain-containing protein n=1 Tax=Acetonema longum DSM 6540 TaxID=1009370 RepID=F7NQD6_9FIRM|nr:3-methyl-2-oxobutanoate dehydrogenase subunit VorB [Acetonema longum]EGO61714.1 pyruvate flavodoxin/ferredoxin oxidoreductase domain-containing protein [Acetonema longum DSM 6540]